MNHKNSMNFKIVKSINDLEAHMKKKPIGEAIQITSYPWKEIEVVRGAAWVRTVIEYNRQDYSISVSDNVVLADTVYPEHNHAGKESFVVYWGAIHLFMRINGKVEKKSN